MKPSPPNGAKHSVACTTATSSFWNKSIRDLASGHAYTPADQSSAGLRGLRLVGWLVGMDGAHRGEDFRISLGNTSFGTSWECDYALTVPGLSSQHFAINVTSNEVALKLLTSQSTVSIEVAREGCDKKIPSIAKGILLEDGDVIHVGQSFRFLFRSVQQNGLTNTKLRNSTELKGWLILSSRHEIQDFRLYRGLNSINGAAEHTDLRSGSIHTIITKWTRIDPQHAVIRCEQDSFFLQPSNPKSMLRLREEHCIHEMRLEAKDTISLGEEVQAYVRFL